MSTLTRPAKGVRTSNRLSQATFSGINRAIAAIGLATRGLCGGRNLSRPALQIARPPLEARIPTLRTLKSRPEFLAVRGGRRSSTPAFLIEMRERTAPAGDESGARFGFTITKKIGNAVTRNRIRRRLKAAFAAKAGEHARQTCDYVIVARIAALDRPFALLLEDVARAFAALHDSAKRSRTNNERSPSHRTPAPKGST
jgi:ribonuclease P protein component